MSLIDGKLSVNTKVVFLLKKFVNFLESNFDSQSKDNFHQDIKHFTSYFDVESPTGKIKF